MRIVLTTTLQAPPEWVAAHLQSTAVFRHIAAPIVRFRPARGAAWPTLWTPGELSVQMWLLGLLPMGPQTVRIGLEPPPQPGGWPTLRDNGEGLLMLRWDHRITLEPLPGGRTRYTDDIEVAARHMPWLMTALSGAFAHLFYRHRQRRWRALARSHSTPGAQPSPVHLRAAFEHLLECGATHPLQDPALRWRWLEAAHVLGQTVLPLHWRAHTAMLRHAVRMGDAREAAGQVLRLALVPLGHGLHRLPVGNAGRSHIPAMRPMVPPADVAGLIADALHATALPPVHKPPG